jgi:hypothetical protein
MLAEHGRVGHAQLGPRRFQRGAGSEPAEQVRHAMHAAFRHGGGEVMRARDHVGDDLGLRRIRHRRLEHSDHRRRARPEPDGFADHGGVAIECRGPEAVRQDGRAVGFRAIVARAEQTAENRMQAHDVEIRPADHAGADLARLAETDQGEADGRKITERAHGFHARAQVLDLRHGEPGVLDTLAGRALADINKTVLVAID